MKDWAFGNTGLEARALGNLTKGKRAGSGKASPLETHTVGRQPAAAYSATPKILHLP